MAAIDQVVEVEVLDAGVAADRALVEPIGKLVSCTALWVMVTILGGLVAGDALVRTDEVVPALDCAAVVQLDGQDDLSDHMDLEPGFVLLVLESLPVDDSTPLAQ